ncbi:hypothetical protein LHGZ1_1813 [Laribacter hongkongensis]|uniref:Uncharacterized protein n=1 Tax=Laribacter hongkongensis TaxID=168471 RepID=A0A248LJK6_9NEIS|nr:hypothetical protein LHGZ1_1813 [Laribacter hongkongensis]
MRHEWPCFNHVAGTIFLTGPGLACDEGDCSPTMRMNTYP